MQAPPYGRTTAVGHAADGTNDVAASRTLNGLEPGTVYHYRLVVTNSAGVAGGSDQTFTTAVALPGVTTDRADGITKTGARLSGAVNPGGGSTKLVYRVRAHDLVRAHDVAGLAHRGQ